jgi:hypothetical protein
MRDILESANFIAVMISAAVSCIALWFIRAQMKFSNQQLTVLSTQLGAMHEANRALHQQMAADHDRKAKELAVNLLITWEQSLHFNTRQVSRLVHRFTEDQCRKLHNIQEFYIDNYLEELATLCFSGDLLPLTKNDKGICISGKLLMHLRFATVSYLNLIESILTAWHQDIVDRTVIEDQFAFLCDSGENALETFRKITGDYYPSTTTFLLRLKEIQQQRVPPPRATTPLDTAARL